MDYHPAGEKIATRHYILFLFLLLKIIHGMALYSREDMVIKRGVGRGRFFSSCIQIPYNANSSDLPTN